MSIIKHSNKSRRIKKELFTVSITIAKDIDYDGRSEKLWSVKVKDRKFDGDVIIRWDEDTVSSNTEKKHQPKKLRQVKLLKFMIKD